jgi:hypothetical protein
MNSIPTPYNKAITAVRINAFLRVAGSLRRRKRAQHHKKVRSANIPVWTHLSNQIFPSQSSLGKEDPGSVSRVVDRMNQPMAGIKEGLILSK